MRPQKLSQAEMLQRSAMLFKIHGYHGTSMDMLAKECGLTKSAFYYYYPNKNALVLDVVKSVRLFVDKQLFSWVHQKDLLTQARYLKLHETAVIFFTQGVAGCLMAILGLDLKQQAPEVFQEIRQFFNEWQNTMQSLFEEIHDANYATVLAKQTVADYEGAILMYRLTDDVFYLDQIKNRVLIQLESVS